jgi:kynurenine formamidase
MVFHGPLVTHLDAPSHMVWDKKGYNGYPAERINSVSGALDLPVTALAEGVTTRGILFDVPRSRGAAALEPGTSVDPEELMRIESEQGTVVHDGDVVFLRTGTVPKIDPDAKWDWRDPKSGWAASCLPWFRERGVSAIGHDGSNDTSPSGYEPIGINAPIHIVGLVALGIWLIDNVALDMLAETCQKLNRWEFMISIAPLRLVGGTGSPINPIATF